MFNRAKTILALGITLTLVSCGGSSQPTGGSGSGTGSSGGGSTPICNASGAYVSSFECLPPGQLLSGSGSGVAEDKIWRAGLRFPIKSGPAYINSQVYRYAGFKFDPAGIGPDGLPFGAANNGTKQCDSRNYSYPWQDTFCEVRGSGDPPTNYCPSGSGHQGLDIRGSICATNHMNNEIVAVDSGKIIEIFDHYTKQMSDDELFFYSYLHMHRTTRTYDNADLAAASPTGLTVVRNDVLGRIGNFQGYNSSGDEVYTTRHLHFEMRTAVYVDGILTINQPLPAYSSMVSAYKDLLDGSP